MRGSCGRCLDEYVASDMVGITLAEIIDHTSFNLCPETETLYADFLLIFQFGVKDIKTVKNKLDMVSNWSTRLEECIHLLIFLCGGAIHEKLSLSDIKI